MVGTDANAKGACVGELFRINKSGNGFIKSDQFKEGRDVFIHKTVIDRANLKPGDTIRFDAPTMFQDIPQCHHTIFVQRQR